MQKIFVYIMSLTIITYCEKVDITMGNYSIFPQGYVLQTLSEYGYPGTIFMSIWNSGSSNPASAIDLSNRRISLSYQYKTPNKLGDEWFNNFKIEQSNKVIPQSIALIFPHRSICLGYSFTTDYSLSFSYDPCIHFDNRKEKTSVYDNSMLISYATPIHLQSNDLLSIGGRFSLKTVFYTVTPKLSQYDVNWSKTGFFWTGGIRYSVVNNEELRNSIGFYYERGGHLVKLITTDVYELSDLYISKIYGNVSIPNKLHMGISSEIFKNIFIAAEASVLKYAELIINKEVFFDNLKDQWQYSVSLIYKKMSGVCCSVSAFYSEDLNTYENMEIFAYLAGSIAVPMKKYNISLSIADSHLYSDKYQQNTIFKIGLGYSL